MVSKETFVGATFIQFRYSDKERSGTVDKVMDKVITIKLPQPEQQVVGDGKVRIVTHKSFSYAKMENVNIVN